MLRHHHLTPSYYPYTDLNLILSHLHLLLQLRVMGAAIWAGKPTHPFPWPLPGTPIKGYQDIHKPVERDMIYSVCPWSSPGHPLGRACTKLCPRCLGGILTRCTNHFSWLLSTLKEGNSFVILFFQSILRAHDHGLWLEDRLIGKLRVLPSTSTLSSPQQTSIASASLSILPSSVSISGLISPHTCEENVNWGSNSSLIWTG